MQQRFILVVFSLQITLVGESYKPRERRSNGDKVKGDKVKVFELFAFVVYFAQ